MLRDLFWRKVDNAGPIPAHRPDLGPCWLWTGTIDGGYAKYGRGPGTRLAHRLAWEDEHGRVPDGMELDHLCRVRHCVRPSHLEAVSHRTNVLRGEGLAARQARQTECHRGHPFAEPNTYVSPRGLRVCRACKRRRYREGRAHRAR